MYQAGNEYFSLELGEEGYLWKYNLNNSKQSFLIKPPVFEIDGEEVECNLENTILMEAGYLKNGVVEYKYSGSIVGRYGLELELKLRLSMKNSIVRFQYKLISSHMRKLTKLGGRDNIQYVSFKGDLASKYKEVRFSELNEKVHSYCLSEAEIDNRYFENELKLIGPMIIEIGEGYSAVAAYEHGSQVPDSFVEFVLGRDYEIGIRGVKGNYYNGQILNEKNSYESIWFQFGAVCGGEAELSCMYREFVLKYMTLNVESRRPYIFYNTWAYQERNKWLNKKTFLDSMGEERILQEIEIAHRIGIEVFVIDTGWYEKTGDWIVNRARFKEGLKRIKSKLEEYGMKLGLWFDPQAAAVSSSMLIRNKGCIISSGGKLWPASLVWETEESYRMCLVSKYYEDFARELIRLVKEEGVTYFKWDAIGQYGCTDEKHFHGNNGNAEEERGDCYAFQVGIQMVKVVDLLCEECPEAIVDFDITEGHRYVGLGFLSAGKYFLINNGPYYGNYDIAIPEDQWSNIFVNPGAARGWICRTPLDFDKWIPSVLFLTHYLPDEPEDSQTINIASLMLGQNGIWGDLLAISENGVSLISDLLTRYKKVREDITIAYPVRTGAVGGSPEVHEKINPDNGRGAVVVFSSNKGKYTYVTQNKVVSEYNCTEGVKVNFDNKTRAVIEVEFDKPGAKIVFFGD